jgi:hypothetical protein
MNARKMLVATVIALSAVGVTTKDSRASACGMGDIDWYADERVEVAHAEEMLDAGEAREAAAKVQAMWPEMSDARPVSGSLPHIAEAVRIMALAAVRTDGDIKEGKGWASKTPADRAANVRWGISRLRMLVKANPDSPTAKSDLGEALARSPKTQKEASDILEELAAHHAIATVEAFAALDSIRLARGDVSGAAALVSECADFAFSFDKCTPNAAGYGPVAAIGR